MEGTAYGTRQHFLFDKLCDRNTCFAFYASLAFPPFRLAEIHSEKKVQCGPYPFPTGRRIRHAALRCKMWVSSVSRKVKFTLCQETVPGVQVWRSDTSSHVSNPRCHTYRLPWWPADHCRQLGWRLGRHRMRDSMPQDTCRPATLEGNT